MKVCVGGAECCYALHQHQHLLGGNQLQTVLIERFVVWEPLIAVTAE